MSIFIPLTPEECEHYDSNATTDCTNPGAFFFSNARSTYCIKHAIEFAKTEHNNNQNSLKESEQILDILRDHLSKHPEIGLEI